MVYGLADVLIITQHVKNEIARATGYSNETWKFDLLDVKGNILILRKIIMNKISKSRKKSFIVLNLKCEISC